MERTPKLPCCQLRPTALELLLAGGTEGEPPAPVTGDPESPEDEAVSPGATTEAPTMVVEADNVTIVDPVELEQRWYNHRLKEVEEADAADEYEEVEEEAPQVKEEVMEKEETVIPTKSLKRLQNLVSGMAQPVVPRPSKALKPLQPLPPPKEPPPSEQDLSAKSQSMPPPSTVPAKKVQKTGWLNKAVVLAHLVKEDRHEEAKQLVAKYEDKDKVFKDTLLQHSGMMRSSGSDPRRDYMTRLK